MILKIKSPWRGRLSKRLTLGPDFILSRSISGAARTILRTAKVTRLYDTTLVIL